MTALKRPRLLILSATAFAPPMVEKSPETASLAPGAAARASRQRSSSRPCKTTSWPCAIRSLAAISPRPSDDPVMKTRAITFLPDDHPVSADWSACIKADCVVPEELALPLAIHLPVQHERDRLGKMALAVRIVRGVHQHAVAHQIDHGVCQPGALRDFDALTIAPASDVIARLTRECRARGFDRFSMFVEPRHPERQPAVPG